ncbi:MAG TPA: outer membrane beta-barrel family protein [Lacibacter sp.]|nr:outer membrane beta-barrel family protein [Lacibacter sp.]HMO89595.1 outer membrane beta-barrel family protein [Lacibacter sp.]
MKHLFFLFALLLAATANRVMAQQPLSVRGTATGSESQPLAGATITLFRLTDSSFHKAAITDQQGSFHLEPVPPGRYYLQVSAIGWEPLQSPAFELRQSSLVLDPLRLRPQATSLKEVVVTGKKPLFEQKPDKLVVNVDASPTNAGATALEVLEKSPGISVDKDGNISLKGKAGVQVFIDGKPTYLSGNDLVNYLRNLSGAQLEQIEIMTNPPARYDAAGNSGIINIRTRKTKQRGYQVSFTGGYTQGFYARNNQNLVFNYRKNRLNLFGNLSRNERNSFQQLDIQRKFMEPNSKQVLTHFDQVSRMQQWNASNNLKLGADWSLSPKSTLGAVVNGFYNPSTFSNKSDIGIADPFNQLLSTTRATSNSRELWQHGSANLNFRHQFDSTGREITADLDYLHYNSANQQRLTNSYFDNTGNPIWQPDVLLGDLPQLINIYSAKMDYLRPLQKGARLEAGWKTSYVQTDNNAVYDSLINGSLVRDLGRSNHFNYTEQIQAAYLTYSRPISPKLRSQLGLRLEHTAARGQQITTGEDFELNYTQLFPTAYLQYQASERHSFSMNYGRRIRRPDYRSLNPFVQFLDRYTFEQGNPYLRPQFSHNLELTHTFNKFLNTTLNYTETRNIIQQIMEQDETTNQTFVKQGNIARQQQVGVAVSAFAQVKQFSGNVYVNVFHNRFEGIVNNTPVDFSAVTAMVNASASYKFPKGQNVELSGFFRTPGYEGVFHIGSFGMLNFGASTPMLKGKGTLRLSVRDLLWTQRINGKVQFGNIDAAFQQLNDSRTATLSFTYRISKGKVNGNGRRKTGGASDEQNRVKAGD